MIYQLTLLLFFLSIKDSVHSRDFIVLQSTTSTRDSGFYDHLLPKFSDKYDFDVRVVAVGTGQAIKNARKCDADVLIAHDKKSEEKLVLDGFGEYRKEFMFNDYVLVGPEHDPANIKKNISIASALIKIVNSKSFFISRGDNSGTNMKEIELWKAIKSVPNPRYNKWYLSVGQGMGGALNVAVNKNAYILSDRATWESFKNKKNHKILVSNKPSLLNFYGVIPISSRMCPNTKEKLAKIFVEWLVSSETKNLINNFKINEKQLFYPLN
jgi:tungstate transport system substrate-binding protein